MDNTEFKNKKEEILSKFDKDFIDQHYLTDALFHQIIEVLIRGGDPYKMIEHLLKERIDLMKINRDLHDKQAPPVIIVKDKNALI